VKGCKARRRHLGELDDAEVADLLAHIADWLQAHGVPGSILPEYSLYTAVQEEHEKARYYLSEKAVKERTARFERILASGTWPE